MHRQPGRPDLPRVHLSAYDEDAFYAHLMAISFEGEPILTTLQRALIQFADELEGHPHGGPVEGRIVQAEPKPSGITATVQSALQMYMKDEEYKRWRAAQVGRMVFTGGKTFVADDEVITAVLCPMPGMGQEFLDLGAHELIEMAELLREQNDEWVRPADPDEADGITLFDEYRNERIRQEIRESLGWPEGKLDASSGLVSMAGEIAERMPDTRLDPPPPEFWGAWLHLGQVWAMVAGRAAAGSASAQRDLREWARHRVAIDDGWSSIADAMTALYQQPGLNRDQLATQAAASVRRPLIAYGREVWRKEP